jgi:hypothetical protein
MPTNPESEDLIVAQPVRQVGQTVQSATEVDEPIRPLIGNRFMFTEATANAEPIRKRARRTLDAFKKRQDFVGRWPLPAQRREGGGF